MIKVPELVRNKTQFMIDTGAAINIIKEKELHPIIPRNTKDTLFITGVTEEKIQTLGTTQITLHGHPVVVNIVTNNFPITPDGILGNEFLKACQLIHLKEKYLIWKYLIWKDVKIPFTNFETILLPARTRMLTLMKVNNENLTFGFLPRLNLPDGIYGGDAVVTVHNGMTSLYITNTLTTEQEIQLLLRPDVTSHLSYIYLKYYNYFNSNKVFIYIYIYILFPIIALSFY